MKLFKKMIAYKDIKNIQLFMTSTRVCSKIIFCVERAAAEVKLAFIVLVSWVE